MSHDEEERAIVAGLEAVMLKKLRANHHKTHWKHTNQSELLRMLRREVDELEAALIDGLDAVDVQRECADVANFAAMIADNARRGTR